MGLFDAFRAVTSPTFDAQKAIMTIVVAAVKSDGDVSEEEVGRIRTICVRSPIFSRNTKAQDDEVITFADNMTRQLGPEALNRAAAALKPELREVAFAFSCDIVLSDSLVGAAEEQFLNQLAATLELSHDVCKTLIHSAVIRNRGLT